MGEYRELPSDKPLESIESSTDWIRLQVEREGVQARNIIKYNLPFSESRPSTFSLFNRYAY